MNERNLAAAASACAQLEQVPEGEPQHRHGAQSAGFVIVLRGGQATAPVHAWPIVIEQPAISVPENE